MYRPTWWYGCALRLIQLGDSAGRPQIRFIQYGPSFPSLASFSAADSSIFSRRVVILIGQWLAFSTTGGHASRCLSLLGQAMRTAQVRLPCISFTTNSSDIARSYRFSVCIKCRVILRKCRLLILLILLEPTASSEKEQFVSTVSSSSSTTCRRLLDSSLTCSILYNVSRFSRPVGSKTHDLVFIRRHNSSCQ